MSFIPRWSIARRVKDQNVAEHSYYTTLYASMLCDRIGVPSDFKLRVLELALYHDMEEIFTGDIPGPAKRILAKEEGYTDHIIPHVKTVIPSYFTKHETNDPNAALIVKFASLVDEAMWMATDMQLGNKSLNLPMQNTTSRMYAVLGEIFDALTPNMSIKERDSVWLGILNDINRAQTGDSRILMG